MSPETERVLAEALRLPHAARAALAGKLLESLLPDGDPDAEEKWALTIEKRVRELDGGRVKPIPWAEARRRIAGGR